MNAYLHKYIIIYWQLQSISFTYLSLKYHKIRKLNGSLHYNDI